MVLLEETAQPLGAYRRELGTSTARWWLVVGRRAGIGIGTIIAVKRIRFRPIPDIQHDSFSANPFP